MLTPAERKCLEQAIADGGEIVMSGIDMTEPRPRRDVVKRLVAKGLLRCDANHQTGFQIGLHDYFRVTKMGTIDDILAGLKKPEYQKHDTVQYSDEMYCKKCKKRWDTNDPNEPDCLPK